MVTFAFFSGPLPWAILAVATVFFLWVDLHFFARGREPTFKEGVWWSIGWLVVSLLAAVVVLAALERRGRGHLHDRLLHRALALARQPVRLHPAVLVLRRARAVPRALLFWGIVAALVLRGLAILGGVALIEQFHFVIYILGVLLLVLAYRILRGVAENVDPDKNFIVRTVRKFFPVTGEFHEDHWFVRLNGTRYVTPLFLCLAAIVAADIAFAVDSIPAAFAITRDSVLIWMGNVFALLGMRALFVLVEGLIRRFRYLDETIAVVLAVVAVKLLIEDLYKIGPVASLGLVAVCFAVGIIASLIADARDPDAAAKQAERGVENQPEREEADSPV